MQQLMSPYCANGTAERSRRSPAEHRRPGRVPVAFAFGRSCTSRPPPPCPRVAHAFVSASARSTRRFSTRRFSAEYSETRRRHCVLLLLHPPPPPLISVIWQGNHFLLFICQFSRSRTLTAYFSFLPHCYTYLCGFFLP